jgi:hypothetical protein
MTQAILLHYLHLLIENALKKRTDKKAINPKAEQPLALSQHILEQLRDDYPPSVVGGFQ